MGNRILMLTFLALLVFMFVRVDENRMRTAWANLGTAASPVVNFCTDNPGICSAARTGYQVTSRAMQIGAGVLTGQGELVYVPRASNRLGTTPFDLWGPGRPQPASASGSTWMASNTWTSSSLTGNTGTASGPGKPYACR